MLMTRALDFGPWESHALQDQRYSGREPVPIGEFLVQLSAALFRERVKFRAAIVVRRTPLGLDQSLALEAIERGIQRTLLNLQHLLRHLLNALRDSPAVIGLKSQRFQNQKIEGALQHIG